jgi:acyl-CoA thioester hydrolase
VTLVSSVDRPHPQRLRPEIYPVHGAIDARYGDMDSNGHLNNLALESLHENARASFNAQVWPDVYDLASRRVRLVTAANVVHFLREAHWPARIETGIGVGRIGRTSYIASTALFISGECVSLCDTALVLLDEHGPTLIPDDAREQLTTMLLPTDAPVG